MEPFRRFLSPKVKFVWTEQLNSIFEESKLRIVDAIKEGVKIFDITRRTCFRTDWSRRGIGYLLAQQHCDCESHTYGCCPDGWKITLAGSRFLSKTESNYAAIEGEALAVAWALEQTRFFTMGCTDLLVIVDHKPLTKIFGDRRLDEIDNPRLFRMKRRTLMWQFDTEYQPGRKNPFADAASCHPNQYAELSSITMMSNEDHYEESLIAGIQTDVERFFAVTWERVQTASRRDEVLKRLVHYILEGFPATKSELPDMIKPFWDAREHLSIAEDVVLYKNRIVIPTSLRDRIIDNLHSAHQGTSGMLSRAQESVYWPGYTKDIEQARLVCRTCHRNAPSQAKMPPIEPRLPKVPFEMIFGDYFQLRGKHFLIIGDRLSGWTEVLKMKPGTSSAGSKGLCEALRKVFVTFGVPEELSSDGGPEFTSQESEDFYDRWGTRHRLSSAYFPQSNGRAEVAVKATKRLLEENMGPDGDLNTDEVVRALLQQRNTPDRDCLLSPAQVLFGHSLRDAMPQINKSAAIFESKQFHSEWHQAWNAKEEAIRSRLVRTCEALGEHSKDLAPLREGDHVFVQNQDSGSPKPKKWDRQGTIVASKDNDQYLVRIHGSGRLSLRNRRFLRKYQLRSPVVDTDLPTHTESDHRVDPVPNSTTTMSKQQVSQRQQQEQPLPHYPLESRHETMPSPLPDPVLATDAPDARSSSHHVELPSDDDSVVQTDSSPRKSQGDLPSTQPVANHLAPRTLPRVTPSRPSLSAPTLGAPLRRSTRDRKPREVYNATTGKSAKPVAVDDSI